MGGSTVKYGKYNRANLSLFDWKKQNLRQTSRYSLYKGTYICIFREEVFKEDMICFMYLLTEWEGGTGLSFIWFSNQNVSGALWVIMIVVTIAQGIFKSILKRIIVIDRLKGGIWLRFHKPWVYLQLELPFRILAN